MTFLLSLSSNLIKVKMIFLRRCQLILTMSIKVLNKRLLWFCHRNWEFFYSVSSAFNGTFLCCSLVWANYWKQGMFSDFKSAHTILNPAISSSIFIHTITKILLNSYANNVFHYFSTTPSFFHYNRFKVTLPFFECCLLSYTFRRQIYICSVM